MQRFERLRIERVGFLVRTYEPRDSGAAWELHIEGLRDTGAYHPDTDPSWDADVRDVATHYLTQDAHFWVVEPIDRTHDPSLSPVKTEDSQLIATAAVRRLGPTTAELRRMRVTSRYRRRGIACLLAEIAEDFCRRHGYSSIVLDTTDKQQAAQALYRSLGYSEASHYYVDSINTTIRRFTKDLT